MKGIAVVVLGVQKNLTKVFEHALLNAKKRGYLRMEMFIVDESLGNPKSIKILKEAILSNIALGITIFTASKFSEARGLIKEILRNLQLGYFDEILVIKGNLLSSLHNYFLKQLESLCNEKLVIKEAEYYAL